MTGSDIRYRKGEEYSSSMAVYMRMLSEKDNNTQEMDRLKVRLRRALREDVTETQRRYLALYYGQRVNMVEIGRMMGVHKSTVSRTIKRGEDRLRRCLRYGAKRFLNEVQTGECEGPDEDK